MNIDDIKANIEKEISLVGKLGHAGKDYVLEIAQDKSPVGMILLKSELLNYLELEIPLEAVKVYGLLSETDNTKFIAQMTNITELITPLRQTSQCNFIDGTYILKTGRLADLLVNFGISELKISKEEQERTKFFLNRREIVVKQSSAKERDFTLSLISNLSDNSLTKVIGGLFELPKKDRESAIQFYIFPDEPNSPKILIEDKTFNCIMSQIPLFYPEGYGVIGLEIVGELDTITYKGKKELKIHQLTHFVIERCEFRAGD